MKISLGCAVLVFTAVTVPAAAQTPAVPGGVTRNGVVTLGTVSTPSTIPYGAAASAAQSAPTTAAATGQGAGSGNFGGRSIAAGAAGPVSSAPASAGGSGSAVGATSSGAAGWIVCPPSGALGIQPFLAGTELSCAP